jgi:hypothetical protein
MESFLQGYVQLINVFYVKLIQPIISFQYKKKVKILIKNKNFILGFILEKSTQGTNTSGTKQPQIIYRNKNGQFASPPERSKSINTVKIFIDIISV